MTWVKVCGITSVEALDAAVEAGADAIGLNLYPSSPRALSIAHASRFADLSSVPAYIVTVDLQPDVAIGLAERIGADGVQNHGANATEVANRAVRDGLLALRPVRVERGIEPRRPSGLDDRAIPLFDAAHDALHGGTGDTFDWDLLAGVDGDFVVAGGLGPDNVAALIAAIRPYGVDASSRLELARGVKDPDTIRSFVREARRS